MEFTYQAYRELLTLLCEQGYGFTDYHRYGDKPRCVILRHDIDQSLSAAEAFAELEAGCGVTSTYFVLLRSDFYNAASRASLEALRHIWALGHEVGLHFDEAAYGRELSPEEVQQAVVKECGILSALLEAPVSTVSMHRPSKATLEGDYKIPGIVNSYGQTFFHDFKYLSDRRRNWREPVLDIVRSGEYSRLHILTHAFWYHETDETISETVRSFVRSAVPERYRQMADNIRDLSSVLKEEEL